MITTFRDHLNRTADQYANLVHSFSIDPDPDYDGYTRDVLRVLVPKGWTTMLVTFRPLAFIVEAPNGQRFQATQLKTRVRVSELDRNPATVH